MWSGCWVVVSSGMYLCARISASLASSRCCSWYITKMMVITTYNIIWLNFVSHLFLFLFLKFWQKNVVYTFPCTNESVSLSDLYSLTQSLRSFFDFSSTQHIVWLQFYCFLFAFIIPWTHYLFCYVQKAVELPYPI